MFLADRTVDMLNGRPSKTFGTRSGGVTEISQALATNAKGVTPGNAFCEFPFAQRFIGTNV